MTRETTVKLLRCETATFRAVSREVDANSAMRRIAIAPALTIALIAGFAGGLHQNLGSGSHRHAWSPDRAEGDWCCRREGLDDEDIAQRVDGVHLSAVRPNLAHAGNAGTVSQQSAPVCYRRLLSRLLAWAQPCLPVMDGASGEGKAAESQRLAASSDADGGAKTLQPSLWRLNSARHEVREPRRGDDLSEERAVALDLALHDLGVDVRALQDAEGNPARKAYYSFINPRAGKRVLGVRESLAHGARRFAAQVIEAGPPVPGLPWICVCVRVRCARACACVCACVRVCVRNIGGLVGPYLSPGPRRARAQSGQGARQRAGACKTSGDDRVGQCALGAQRRSWPLT